MKKAGRPKSAKLSREAILERTLEMIDEMGVEKLSMRGVARSLGVDPMALYHYFEKKEALIDGVVKQVFQGFEIDFKGRETWKTRIRRLMDSYRTIVLSHKRLTYYLILSPRTALHPVLLFNESLFQALREAGLPKKKITPVGNLLVDYLHGYCLGESSKELKPGIEISPLDQHLADASKDEYPALRYALSGSSKKSQQENFNVGLDFILGSIGNSH